MVAALTQMTHTLTTDNLQEAGFTVGEIKRLVELRDRYPYLEFTDSLRQWDHLKFMKWRYTNGDLARV
ncbi:MAG: hypothetical protein H0V47_09615 [Chloroflexia bacterium]|nr:hypothetical protein [Chloroflexia bacterium]